MTSYLPGQRYSLDPTELSEVLAAGYPIVRGEPDLSRGRRYVLPPYQWEFWMLDGTRVAYLRSQQDGSLIVAQTAEPDPDLPPSLFDGQSAGDRRPGPADDTRR